MHYPNISPDALLDRLGLQHKPSASTQMLTFGALIMGGVVVGAAAALLLAPKSGRELRGDLQKGAHQLSDTVSAKAHSAVASAQSAVAAAQRKVSAPVGGGNGHSGEYSIESDAFGSDRT